MGRGKAQHNMDLIEAAWNILEDIQPASVRVVCYQLFIHHMIGSMSRNETNRVSKQLVDARVHGEIPWEWIVDETREAETVASWDDPKAFAEAASRQYRDFWQQQPTRVEVWSEKGTIRGTLKPILDQFGVTFRVFHGHTSATVVRDIVESHLAQLHKPFIALYVGDCDPAGMCMSEKGSPEPTPRLLDRAMPGEQSAYVAARAGPTAYCSHTRRRPHDA